MSALPASHGGPGYAVVFETSGHTFALGDATKELASFAPSAHGGIDGDFDYFRTELFPLCAPITPA